LLRTIEETSELIRRRSLSPVEVTRECLARIEKLNSQLNAFITVTADSALADAKRAELEIQRGNWRGPLHGIPIGLKDIIDTAGVPTTAASKLFRNRIPTEDADVVIRLKQAGAVLLGKQNLHEFAYGGSSMISCFGEVRNAWNVAHIAGGSSGGSATSVAAGLGLAAIGTDTAGSIREPASQCGVVGLKPHYGRVSAQGVIPLSQSLDHVGPIAANVTDAAILLNVIADPQASDASGRAFPGYDFAAALHESPKPLRLGVPRSFFFEDLDPEVEAAFREALTVLRTLTAEVKDVELAVSTDRTLQSAESYAYHREWVEQSPEIYQPETLRRIMTGAKFTPADYQRSLLELEIARRDIAAQFQDIDLMVTPTIPIPAPSIAELKKDPAALRPKEIVLLRNTRPWNVWGVPTISVPCGFTESSLPIGLQIAGAPWREDVVLRLAYAYEQATVWHKRQPRIAASAAPRD
jgi:aspartyl-tRNA(Asn)/glutamyl-tRNA(Gln) amidotransferase subunit A